MFMKMKTSIRNQWIALLSAIAFLPACSDLIERPTSFENSDTYYQTPAQCISGLNGCYIPIRSIYTYTYVIVTEGVTDLMYIKSGTLDAQLDISPSQPRYGATMWQQGYLGVARSNAIIAAIRRAPFPDAQKLPLLAEGMVMRAFYYWFLTCNFGDVPFYTEEVKDEEVLERVGKLGRMSAVATRDCLIDELKQYVPYLPQERTADNPDNRCGAAMGWMMIGKLAQWNHRWEDARDAMDRLEGIYGDLDQYPLEDIMFRYKNRPESIFEAQFVYNAGGLQVLTSACAVLTPYPASSGVYAGVAIPELGTRAQPYTPCRLNDYYVQNVMPNNTDRRLRFNAAWNYDGKPFNLGASDNGRPFPGPKFWAVDMVNANSGANQKIFRYADALLMQAENYMELRDTEMSIHYLNMTRRRAGLPDYVFKNMDALREEIQKERGRELLGEYQRKYDLVRWGIWYRMVFDWTGYGTAKNNLRPCHEYYPIPDTEVVYSGHMLDNKAYEEYGKS
jgi:hypothetical protein